MFFFQNVYSLQESIVIWTSKESNKLWHGREGKNVVAYDHLTSPAPQTKDIRALGIIIKECVLQVLGGM